MSSVSRKTVKYILVSYEQFCKQPNNPAAADTATMFEYLSYRGPSYDLELRSILGFKAFNSGQSRTKNNYSKTVEHNSFCLNGSKYNSNQGQQQ